MQVSGKSMGGLKITKLKRNQKARDETRGRKIPLVIVEKTRKMELQKS